MARISHYEAGRDRLKIFSQGILWNDKACRNRKNPDWKNHRSFFTAWGCVRNIRCSISSRIFDNDRQLDRQILHPRRVANVVQTDTEDATEAVCGKQQARSMADDKFVSDGDSVKWNRWIQPERVFSITTIFRAIKIETNFRKSKGLDRWDCRINREWYNYSRKTIKYPNSPSTHCFDLLLHNEMFAAAILAECTFAYDWENSWTALTSEIYLKSRKPSETQEENAIRIVRLCCHDTEAEWNICIMKKASMRICDLTR
jgi:hypothetical protein